MSAMRVVDDLHPAGACTCAGEGQCEWCIRTEAAIDQAPPSSAPAYRPFTSPEGKGFIAEGGAKAPPMGPNQDGREGVVDPAMAKMVAEGATSYHLHTVGLLAEEAAACETLAAVTDKPVAIVLDDTAKTHAAFARQMAVSMSTLMVAVGLPEDLLRPEPEGSGLAIAKLHERITPTRVGVAGGCRSAGCRTLDECMCDCKKCHFGCFDRKNTT